MKFKSFQSLIYLALLIQCREPFDLELPNENAIVLQATISTETLNFQKYPRCYALLQYSRPLDDQLEQRIKDADIYVYQNDAFVGKMVPNIPGDPQQNYFNYSLLYLPIPGLNYKVIAVLSNQDTIQGEVKLPKQTGKLKLINYVEQPSIENLMNYEIQLELKDSIDLEHNYYELIIGGISTILPSGTDLLYRICNITNLDEHNLSLTASNNNLSFLIDDKLFNGSSINLNLRSLLLLGEGEKRDRLRFTIRNVSESYYKYQTSIVNQVSQLPTDLFTIPTVYSNVEGGLGVVQGFSNEFFDEFLK